MSGLRHTFATRTRVLVLSMFACAVCGAETAIHNVNGYTSTDSGIVEFDVLVISDEGKVAATGDADLLGDFPDAMRVDGKGATILPGLTDSHAHVYDLGFLAISLDLAGTPSLEEVVAKPAEEPVRRGCGRTRC